MKKESNKNWTTCLRLNTGDGSPRVFLLNSHFLGSVPNFSIPFLSCMIFTKFAVDIFYDIFSIESFGDSILFERSMLLALLISMGIHIYKNMNTPPE